MGDPPEKVLFSVDPIVRTGDFTKMVTRARGIMGAAKHTLALYALIVVIVEAIFSVVVLQLSGTAQILTIAGMITVIILLIAIAGYRWVNPIDVMPSEISSLWTEEDIPIPQDFAESLKGRWNCRWTYRKPSGELAPYVDDMIDIQTVDYKTGILEGKGLSIYGSAAGYKIVGRVSKRRLMHLFYSTPPPKMGLSGMVILRVSPLGNLQGWWLGTGREGSDIGGNTIWIRESDDKDFKMKSYPIETDTS